MYCNGNKNNYIIGFIIKHKFHNDNKTCRRKHDNLVLFTTKMCDS